MPIHRGEVKKRPARGWPLKAGEERLLQTGSIAQQLRFVGFFPREMFTTKVTVCCGFFVDRVQQIQHLNQTVWAQVEELTYQQSQLFRRHFLGAPKVSTMMEVGSATPIA